MGPLPEKKRKPVSLEKNPLKIGSEKQSSTTKDPMISAQFETNNFNERTGPILNQTDNQINGSEVIVPKESLQDVDDKKIVPNCDSTSKSSVENSTVISDINVHKDNINQLEKASDKSLPNETCILNESEIKSCQVEKSVSGKASNSTEPENSQPTILSSLTGLGSEPALQSASKPRSESELTNNNSNKTEQI